MAGEVAEEPEIDFEALSAAPMAGGFAVIRDQLRLLPSAPGVYRMLGENDEPLYVGKARNLKRRVASYTRATGLSGRILRMIDQTVRLEIVTTHTEAEALLLEANLIKKLKPRYNVVLRDDKSFPYILIGRDHEFPRIAKHRGARNRKGDYFGPFASTWAVNRTITALQRAFPLRSCGDNDFATRTRPCLQFQIKRCTAPCVGRIDAAGYGAIVAEARDFLTGENDDPSRVLSSKMNEAAARMDFEAAALFRDRIRALAHITARQDVNVTGLGEADVIAAHQEAAQTCVQVFFYRAGQNFGNRAYYPKHGTDVGIGEILAAFIAQFYDNRQAPRLILLSHDVENADLIAEALTLTAGRKVEILVPQRGTKADLVQHAETNAKEALGRRLAENSSQAKLLEGVADLFGLAEAPRRVEVYDNSHIQGAQAIGGMIVAGPEGFVKSAYRKFNMDGDVARGGDDFAMMRAMLTRRFNRLVKEDSEGNAENRPDLVLIDGGKAQLQIAVEVLTDLGLIDDVPVVAISKGPDRDAGREQFHLPGRDPVMLEPRHPVLYFLQRLRDEAHRFAIGGHRARRSKAIGVSPIDEIDGIGPARKKALLQRFGSAKGVGEAGLEDLMKVEGISETVAQRIYDHFHGRD